LYDTLSSPLFILIIYPYYSRIFGTLLHRKIFSDICIAVKHSVCLTLAAIYFSISFLQKHFKGFSVNIEFQKEKRPGKFRIAQA
jgi:hypothetical protein